MNHGTPFGHELAALIIAAAGLALVAKAAIALATGKAVSFKFIETYRRADDAESFWRQLVGDAAFGSLLLGSLVFFIITGRFYN